MSGPGLFFSTHTAYEGTYMKCLACGDWDVYWVQTVMHNQDEGYEEYACNCCKSRSEYGFKIIERKLSGENNVVPPEQS